MEFELHLLCVAASKFSPEIVTENGPVSRFPPPPSPKKWTRLHFKARYNERISSCFYIAACFHTGGTQSCGNTSRLYDSNGWVI